MTSVQSVARAMAILRAVGLRPSGLVELSEQTGLATSTTARLLSTLEHEGALRRRAFDGRYVVGPTLEQLVGGTDTVHVLEPVVRPYLTELSALLDEAVCLALVQGNNIVTVNQVDAPKPVQAEDWTGTKVPMHAGSAGVVAMATWSDANIDSYLARPLEVCSANTVTDPKVIWERIRKARIEGVEWSHGEYVEGLSCASAAIIDGSGTAIGALYTYGPSYRYPSVGQAAEVANQVRRRARAISEQLGYTESLEDAS